MADDFPIVAPKEALAFFRNKGLTTGFAWQDVWQEEHARSFTVAKAMSRDLLEDMRAAVDKALAEGTTLADFQRDLKPLLERKGWWGRKEMRDPLTGEMKTVQLGSPRRLKIIFEVNMRSAYAAGRWERAQRVKTAFPYLRYVTVGDTRVRPEHADWHGVIRPIDDVFWDTHYPPCGWSCRCEARSLSKGMVEREGWEVTEDPPSFPKLDYVNPRTGEVSKIERGIDPGFNFNIGRAYLDSLTPQPGPGGGNQSNAGETLEGFLGAFDQPNDGGKVIFDTGGWPLAIAASWFRKSAGKPVAPGTVPGRADSARRLGQRIAGALTGPAEIRHAWVADAAGQQRLVRHYIAGQGDNAVGVEVGRSWRYVVGAEVELWRTGELAWPNVARPGRPAARTIGVLVDRALSEPGNQEALGLEPVSDAAPAELRGMARVIQADDLRHMMARHGQAGIEEARDQIALTPQDLKRLPEIAAQASRFRIVRRRSGMGDSVTWEAVIDGVRYVVAERIGRKRGRLIVKSIVKKPV